MVHYKELSLCYFLYWFSNREQNSDIRRKNKMTIWFTSDNHFGHHNIIKYCNRPFKTVEEMDETMISNWNAAVKDEYDIVYHLGDFTFGDFDLAQKYFSQLEGRIRILSNAWHHDKYWLKGTHIFTSKNGHLVEILPPMVVLEYPYTLVLCHYPIAWWDRRHYGSWHLHGHSHGTYIHKEDDLAFDVGVDCNQFYPISLEGVVRQMNECEIINKKIES